MSDDIRPPRSVAVFCGSSPGADPAWMEGAAALGRILAAERVRLVYGGGAVGLMGACAKAVIAGGGSVLGVIPEFLRLPEVALDAGELVVVQSMHERKAIMFREADGFAILPGGVGTLEEAIELLSWARLGLHAKPMVFLDAHGYWRPLFELLEHTMRQGLTPQAFRSAYGAVQEPQQILPALRAVAAGREPRRPTPLSVT